MQSDAKMLGENPKNVTARVELIQAYINSENYAQAKSLADEGVKLLPSDARLWSARGAAYYDDGMTKRSSGSPGTEELKIAADSYDQALKLDPSVASPNMVAAAFAQYGLLLWQSQQYRECIPYAEKATNLYAKAWQYRMLGRLRVGCTKLQSGCRRLSNCRTRR
ncbi:MAG: tetratricopeptide repeat protein [Candidatus Eremiobacteraeota bacterium]|nr:tetratricopeptide repeat protein [Candidatus Eremiobacteraeota bacterium]